MYDLIKQIKNLLKLAKFFLLKIKFILTIIIKNVNRFKIDLKWGLI